jgi:hypothetical protein
VRRQRVGEVRRQRRLADGDGTADADEDRPRLDAGDPTDQLLDAQVDPAAVMNA